MKITAETTRYEILDALLDDGYELAHGADAAEVSREIQSAVRSGTLVWTHEHIVDTRRGRHVVSRGRVVSVEPR
jgi:hypothetical protein